MCVSSMVARGELTNSIGAEAVIGGMSIRATRMRMMLIG